MFIVVNLSILTVLMLISPAFGAGQEMMRTRVPADKLQEARALNNPLTATPETLEKGKAIYEGKGTCFNCHGMTGRGNGPGAVNLDPPPRVFKSHGFWKHRTEGEIFWVIKHGSPGTAMIPFGGLLSDEEIWTVMLYERSFMGGRGHGGGGRHGASGMDGGHGQQDGSNGKGEQKGKRGHGQHHQDSLKNAEQAASAAINIEQAIRAATAQVAGTVIEVEFEAEEGKAVWEVEVFASDGKIMEVQIDSESGTILSVEEKSQEKKQKHMRKRKGKKGEHEKDQGCCSKEEGGSHGGHHKEH